MIDHDAIIRQQYLDQSYVEGVEQDILDDEEYDTYDYPWVEDEEDFVPLEYYEEQEYRFIGTKIA